jgi:hypothetical protein
MPAIIGFACALFRARMISIVVAPPGKMQRH